MNVKMIYRQLYKKYGRQGWWPLFMIHDTCNMAHDNLRVENGVTYGIPYSKLPEFKTRFRDPYFEIAVGAILTQNTAWKNVATAIKNLYEAKALTPERVLKLNTLQLQKLIRSAGYYRQKTKKLRLFSRWLINEYDGNLLGLQVIGYKLYNIRKKFLEQWGIGKETADSIILYALDEPIFVIDEYTRRLCKKYGIVYKEYDEYRELFERALPKSAKLFQEYHALIVAWGKS